MSPLRSRSGGRTTVVVAIRSARPGVEILRKRAAAGRDHANVNRIAAVEPDRPNFAGREHAVETFLGFGGQSGDFVEDQRSAVRLHELAGLCCKCARERALFVAEQLAVDNVRGDRFAIERQ